MEGVAGFQITAITSVKPNHNANAEINMSDKETIKELREWLAKLPPEFDNVRISSVVEGHPSIARHVIAWRDSTDPKCIGVTVCSKATGLGYDFLAAVKIVSCFQ